MLDDETTAAIVMARNAIRDAEIRAQNKGSGALAGNKVWKKREPLLAKRLLKALGQPEKLEKPVPAKVEATELKKQSNIADQRILAIKANADGEIRLIAEKMSEQFAEICQLKFERDRMRIAWEATHDLLLTVLADYADPERFDDVLQKRLLEVKPDA